MPRQIANSTDRESASDWAARPAAFTRPAGRLEEYSTCSVFAVVFAVFLASVLMLGLFVSLSSADAATVHHPKRRHVMVRPNEGLNFDGLNFGPAGGVELGPRAGAAAGPF